MGILCCKETQSEEANLLAPGETEISFLSYSSSNDKMFEKVEKKYNLLKHITLVNYINYLSHFSIETATQEQSLPLRTEFSSKDDFLLDMMSHDEFQSFIENKILKHKELYTLAGEDEYLENVFRDSMIEIVKQVEFKLNQHYNTKNEERITKGHLLILGMLFCTSTNISKVKLLFDIFANEQHVLTNTEKLKEFILGMIVVSSYCMVAALKKVGGTHPKIPELSREELKRGLEAAELKDCQQLMTLTVEEMFHEAEDGLDYTQFKTLFQRKTKNMGWMFKPKGIRQMLERHNID